MYDLINFNFKKNYNKFEKFKTKENNIFNKSKNNFEKINVEDLAEDEDIAITQTYYQDLCKYDCFTLKKSISMPQESDQDKVVKLLKGGFEKIHGITFERFMEVYYEIVETCPEKLI